MGKPVIPGRWIEALPPKSTKSAPKATPDKKMRRGVIFDYFREHFGVHLDPFLDTCFLSKRQKTL